MSVREIVFSALLAGAAAAVVYGISLISIPAAWIAGGVFVGLWSWVVLTEVGGPPGVRE